MTAPYLSLAQILNRLTLTARAILRHHRPGTDDRCPVCRIIDCPVTPAARNVLHAIGQVRQRGGEVQQRSTATDPAVPDPDDPQQAR